MPDVNISVGVESGAVTTGLASIRNAVQQTGSEIRGILAFGAAGMFAGLVAAVQQVVGVAQQIHREAARFGIDAQQLQVLGNAAKEDGASLEIMARAMNKAVLAQQEAITQGGKMQAAFNSLNISVTELVGLDPQQLMLRIADGVAQAHDKTEAFSAVAHILGSRFGTELIPMLQRGSAGILEVSKSFHTLTTQEINELNALKVEEDKYLQHLQTFLGEIVVGWGRTFGAIKINLQNFGDSFAAWLTGKSGDDLEAKATARWKAFYQNIISGLGPSAASLIPGAGASSTFASGATAGDLTGGGAGGAGGSGGLAAKWEANRMAVLSDQQKLADLTAQRVKAASELANLDKTSLLAYEKSEALQQQIADLDGQIIPLDKQINDQKAQQTLEDQKAVDAIDRKIAQSQGEMAVQDLISQGLTEQTALLQTELDYNEKIAEAIDKANEAYAKGDRIIGDENLKLAQQLQLQREQALAAMPREDRPGWVQTATGWRPSAAGPGGVLGGWGTAPFSLSDYFQFYDPNTGKFDNAAMQRYQLRRQAANLRWQASGSQVLPASMRAGGEFGTDFWSQIELSQRQADFTRRQEAAQRQSSLNFANILDELAAGRMPSAAMWYSGVTGPIGPGGIGNTGVQVAQLATQISLLQQQLDKLTHIDANLTPRPGGI